MSYGDFGLPSYDYNSLTSSIASGAEKLTSAYGTYKDQQAEAQAQSQADAEANVLTEEEQASSDAERDEQIALLDSQITTIQAEQEKLQEIINSADTSTSEGQNSYLQAMSANNALMQNLVFTQILRDQAKEKVVDDDGKEKDKWGLKELANVVTLLGAGIAVGDSLMSLLDDDEIQPIDIQEEVRKATEASTDPVVADKLISAGYRDQPRITDLENVASYRNQFGSLSGELFRDPAVGSALESAYQKHLEDNPNIQMNRDQFIAEFAENNPMHPLSGFIQQKLSRMNQIAQSSSDLYNIDTGLKLRGFDHARNFYKPIDEGGMGFTPDSFRSGEQKQIVNRAMGLVNNPDTQLLRDSIGRRVRSQGELSTDEIRDITGSALTSVDPSLQNQQFFRSGGLARALLNNAGAKRNRLIQDEASYASLMGQERADITTANNVVASNTIDPVSAFGLQGSNTQLANQIYSTNPTQGLNYDPTSQYFSSLSGANASIAQANMATPSFSSKFQNFAGDVDTFVNNKYLNS